AERAATDVHVGSAELAALHLSRLLGRASLERVGERAAEAARTWAAVGLCFAAIALASAIVEPFRIIEGLDVLAARGGDAPLRLDWLDEVEIVARPPEYLHQDDAIVFPFVRTSQPRGTTLVVRGHVAHAGRHLVLTDGNHETPFVDDGGSGVVARWTIQDS